MQKKIIKSSVILLIIFTIGVFFVGLNKSSIYDTKNLVGQKITKIQLEHLILSYQGRREWQSPVEPQTIEAVLLHTINYMDSQVNFMSRDEK